MSAILVATGETYWLDSISPKSTADTWKIGLFKNSPVITRNTVLADLTACDFAGYAALNTGAYGAAILDGANIAYANPTSNSFVFTRSTTGTAQTANGWYLFKGAVLIMAET